MGEVTCIERDEQDNYMMVACDGIYDVMSNDEIVEFINDRFTREENEGNIRHSGPESSLNIEGLLEQIQQNGDIVRRCHPDQYGILAKRGLIQNIFESLTSRQSGDSA